MTPSLLRPGFTQGVMVRDTVQKREPTEIALTNIHAYELSRTTRVRPGFCVDTGAPASVVGLNEIRHIYSALHRKFSLRPSRKSFRFADAAYKSVGVTTLPLLTPVGVPNLYVKLDVVTADVPALLGLDVLDSHSLTADTVSNKLIKKSVHRNGEGTVSFVEEWSVPLRRADGHVYVDIAKDERIFFSAAQLQKLHRQFVHPSANKLYNLLKKARPSDTTSETLEALQELTRRCDACQRIQNAPVRFRVSLGSENLQFNEDVFMDIMYLEHKPVLHVVDAATRFSAARFLSDVSTTSVWAAFVECWASVYVGLPNRIRVDRGSCFGDNFYTIAIGANIDVARSGIEAHSSLGIGERYHQPLRNTYRKAKLSMASHIPDSSILAMCVKAMNDTLGPEGLVPSALVFGVYPSTHVFEEPRDPKPTLQERAKLANTIRAEMDSQMALLRVNRALRHDVPPASDSVYEIGDQVLVFREKQVNNRIGEWLGPFTVCGVNMDSKLVYVHLKESESPKAFGLAQVKKYHPPEISTNHLFTDLHDALYYFGSRNHRDGGYLNAFATEVINKSDPRFESQFMRDAKKAEIKGLMERETFKVVKTENIPPDATILPGRFVLAIKNVDGLEKYKARYVIGGHRDSMKDLIVHQSQNIQPSSIRLILALAAINSLYIWTSDVRQAYLQSDEKLSRPIFIKNVVPEFEISSDEALHLVKPLYGLSESGDLWFETLDKHHKKELGMKPLRSDPALYTKLQNGRINGLSGTYVDDILRAGTFEFRNFCLKTNQRFEMAPNNELPCVFAGFSIERDAYGTVILNQRDYIYALKILPEDATYRDFTSMRMKLAWLSHSRPDCLFEISQLTQVTKEHFAEEPRAIVRRTNKLIRFAKTNDVSLRFIQLRPLALKIFGFSDASFAGNRDLTSQLGYVVFIGDSIDRVIPLIFKSYKARRVTRSVLGAELIAFSDMFDVSYTLRCELEHLCGGDTVPVQLFTDNKTLFDVVSKGSRTSEKRLMLDIACTREGFKKMEINDIGLIRSVDNIADGLTKVMSQAKLQTVLKSGSLDVTVEQWIIRN